MASIIKPELLCGMAAVASAIALILSAVALYESLDNDDDKGQSEYTLYFGMDPGTSETEKEKLKDRAVEIATGAGFGYTCHWAEGGYSGNNGVVKGQETLVFIMAHTTGDFVEDLAEKIKKEFGLDTVMIETSHVDIDFE